MFCVYVLESKKDKDKIYTGFTKNLQKRITEHNKGKNKSTKPYFPWKSIYCEYCINEQDARRRERYFKTSQGRTALNRRIREYLKEL